MALPITSAAQAHATSQPRKTPIRVSRGFRDLARKVGLKSLGDGPIDTTSASGELIFHIFTSLAQFERKLIQERTRAGLHAARARGRKEGRKRMKLTHPGVQMAKKLHADKTMPIADICTTLRISWPTLYRYVAMT